MISAVTTASSATGMSLVPAETTTMRPLAPLLIVLMQHDAAGESAILRAFDFLLDRLELFFAGAGCEHVGAVTGETREDFGDLWRSCLVRR